MAMHSSPLYETDEDRARQRALAQRLSSLWSCDFILTPRKYPVDCVFTTDDHAWWVELKHRNNSSTKYSTLIIDKKKLVAGIEHSKLTGWPFFVVVHWSDGVFMAQVTETTRYFVDCGGRTDRRDPNDIDVVAYLPVREFRRIM